MEPVTLTVTGEVLTGPGQISKSGTADVVLAKHLNHFNVHALPEPRLDASVRRLLAVQFDLGLFDNPFVDEDFAAEGCSSM